MARVRNGEKDDLQEALPLLARVKDPKVVSACQGSAMLRLEERQIYLPSCHALKAVIIMNNFPQRLKRKISFPFRMKKIGECASELYRAFRRRLLISPEEQLFQFLPA